MIQLLDFYRMQSIGQIGLTRMLGALFDGQHHRHGLAEGGHDIQYNVEAAWAEWIISRFLNLHYPGIGGTGAPDVGLDQSIQVRASGYGGNVHLIMHKDDLPDSLYYFVRRFPCSNRFQLFKPVLGRYGMREKFWLEKDSERGRKMKIRNSAFFVDVEPMESPEQELPLELE